LVLGNKVEQLDCFFSVRPARGCERASEWPKWESELFVVVGVQVSGVGGGEWGVQVSGIDGGDGGEWVC
jgi:hypothetical protein